MVLKGWVEVRKLHKASDIPPIKVVWLVGGWLYWAFLAACLLIVSALTLSLWGGAPKYVSWFPDIKLPLDKDSAMGLAACVAVVGFGCMYLLGSRAFSKAFKAEYDQHDIAGLPKFQRRRFLRYALFLRGLKEQAWSHDDIERQSKFAQTFPKPELLLRTFQQPLVTSLLTISIAIALDVIRLPETWNTGRGATLVRIVGYLIVAASVLGLYRVFKTTPITTHQELQQFLQWAELDTQEQQPDPTANGAVTLRTTPAYPCARAKMP